LRRLIINADDFGLTPGVNRAIVEAQGHGVVTSATLMATGAAFDHAVQLAKATPRLSIGCHLVFVDGRPLLAPEQIRTLIASDAGGEARLRNGLVGFAAEVLAGRVNISELEGEAFTQIRELQNAGVVVSHLDTHKHTHMFQSVLRALLRAAKASGVPAIRNPFEPLRLSLLAAGPRIWKRWFQVKTLHALAAGFRRAVEAAGMLAPDGAIGVAATGVLDEPLFRSLIDGIPEGTWEFVCHPGYNDMELQSVRTRLLQSRADELQLLTSASTRDLLAEKGIQLISYRDLG
jgi:chitin disaccharide deacetylase